MTLRPAAALLAALAPGFATAALDAACLSLSANPGGTTLRQLELPVGEPVFTITYVHSVTRTPVVETYHAEGNAIVQTQIRFAQHGPGLPTQADDSGTFERRDGQFVLSMARRFPVVVMRVHADQRPRLATGAGTVDLAEWGNRSVALRAIDAPCLPH